ncbi:ATP-binding protein [Olsenella sp. Marseille-P4559]|uniref:ATP-binding protein n=1 Tax=Olsenella sp. Marseille-P4559 TaxID=2364795 RepID=UPI00102FCF10|nr:ATP-binding protein [Olsenella sp. Marseille-P4559]
MTLIPRTISAQLERYATWFPVVSVTGPRQSGKSTSVRTTFPDYSYVNLEDNALRKQALDDPVGFIRNRPRRLIIDEAQYAPELFSMIQVSSDESPDSGQYVLSGSQNFLLLKQITQSLAGRVGILRLLPLSFAEALNARVPPSVDEFMYRGGYPRLYDAQVPITVFFRSYVDTYVQRDVADYLDVRSLSDFRRFLGLCALNAGNLVNYAGIARDAGVDSRTVKAWLNILESSYITFSLMPYFRNEGKRLTKRPKLYFYDTGLLCYLLNIASLEELLVSPHLGMVFENLIVAETLKHRMNEGKEPRLFFYRDDSKVEVDLLDLADASNPRMAEVKSSQTYRDRFAMHLGAVGDSLGIPRDQRFVITRESASHDAPTARVMCARDWLLG